MTEILYTIERPFMRKTFEAIDQHIDLDSAYIPLRPEARGCCPSIPEIGVNDPQDADANIRMVDPSVVVYNHQFRIDELEFHQEYPLVHIRHGASIGRGEIETTTESLGDVIDTALAPGDRWARRYRMGFPADVRVAVVGVPEADDLAVADPPRERRILYAPTNHNYGGGSYLQTAEKVLDLFADTDYELLFRPHPHDRTEAPGRSLTEACRERITDLSNVVFDNTETPRKSALRSDLLISDYSGVITEWLHTGRPLIQLTDVVADRDIPEIGVMTGIDDLGLEAVDGLYERGYPPAVAEREAAFRDKLGVPMDGQAGERAAREVAACAQ